jgi:hypothetical protein
MSESTTCLPPSSIKPIAMPATGCDSGTPASIIARHPPHTLAIDDEPLDSMMSLTMRTVYGKRSLAE